VTINNSSFLRWASPVETASGPNEMLTEACLEFDREREGMLKSPVA
jgi:hypothetical protein